jgi:hypothetical protein
MAAKKINFKELLLQKGERIALGAAAVIMLALVIVFGLASALGGSSPTKNSTALEDLRKRADQAHQNSHIQNEAQVREYSKLPEDLKVVAFKEFSADLFACPRPYFVPNDQEDRKWRRPNVLAADEFHVDLLKGAVQTYILGKDAKGRVTVVLLKTKANAQETDAAKKKNQDFFKEMVKKRKSRRNPAIDLLQNQFPPELMGVPGGPAMRGRGREGMQPLSPNFLNPQSGMVTGTTATEQEMRPVAVEKLENESGTLAETDMPVRMVIVTGAFPYYDQVQEFRKALRFSSEEELMADLNGHPEFAGFNVKRRSFGPDGKVVEDWREIDLETPMKFILVRSVGIEPDDPDLITYGVVAQPNRLVMPRPQLARDRDLKYPDVKLESIEESLTTLKKENQGGAPPPAPKSRFEDPGDIYDLGNNNQRPILGGSTQDERPQQGLAPPGKGTSRPGGTGRILRPDGNNQMPPIDGSLQQRTVAIPKKCMVRFIDTLVAPGFSYEYQIQIKMVNPNFGQAERAIAPGLTKDKEIEGPWVPVKWAVEGQDGKKEEVAKVTVPMSEDKEEKNVGASKVTVPDELFYYAVDEKPSGSAPAANQERVAVQIHRWVQSARTKPSDKNSEFPVGDWSILERHLVYRGEYLGHIEEVEVPFWNPVQQRLAFALHPEEQIQKTGQKGYRIKKHKGIPIDFASDPVHDGKALLIDFEGGARSFTNGGNKTVKAEGPVEMLILSAEGKLIVRNSRDDTEDKDRQERYTAWKTMIDKVKNQGDDSPSKDSNLFQRPASGKREGGNTGQ